jgi:hypothetical protein
MLANAVTEPLTGAAYETEGEAVEAAADALSEVRVVSEIRQR